MKTSLTSLGFPDWGFKRLSQLGAVGDVASCSWVNAELVGNKTVLLEKDISETDRYGRLLRCAYVAEVLINAELVRPGYARGCLLSPPCEVTAPLPLPCKRGGPRLQGALGPDARSGVDARHMRRADGGISNIASRVQ